MQMIVAVTRSLGEKDTVHQECMTVVNGEDPKENNKAQSSILGCCPRSSEMPFTGHTDNITKLQELSSSEGATKEHHGFSSSMVTQLREKRGTQK
ncbi:rCG28917 [Rattus norvegicus]|uniref:RCG28917 n=1 Tax=Rattus norvegicus TaxID=10116 RepID=A6HVY2_RAT|nr:rCG28917 [Rattus norvegicus]